MDKKQYMPTCVRTWLLCCVAALCNNGYSMNKPFTLPNQLDWESSLYFNTQFLRDDNAVKNKLTTEENFELVQFTSKDGYQLEGLWRKVENAKCTVIFTAGFWPGKMTGLATFVKMLPPETNILFFNVRGRGQSQGRAYFLNVWNYGKYEHNDVIAAIEFAHNHSHAPLILHGICFGAFASARAVIDLHQELADYNIKALIMDSAMYSIKKMAHFAMHSFIDRDVPTTALKTITHAALTTFRTVAYNPFMQAHEMLTCLRDKMHLIKIPVYFVHDINDNVAQFDDIVKIAHETPNKKCWWITQPTRHAYHHLKLKHEYGTRLVEFLNSVL